MSEWKTTFHKKVKISPKGSILIEGMPGIGNVGKIAADVIVEQLKAERVASFFSQCLPNSVFVQEDNSVALPKIEIYHKKVKKQDFIFLVGDIQPMKEEDSYKFAEAVLAACKKLKCREIAALGGIGPSEEPLQSKVFTVGTDKKIVSEFVKLGANGKLYGVVGPIMGITGLLLGLSPKYKMPAVAILAETYASPMHIGLREAKELVKILEKKYALGINISEFDKDIKKFERALKPKAKQQELLERESEGHHQDTSYIG